MWDGENMKGKESVGENCKKIDCVVAKMPSFRKTGRATGDLKVAEHMLQK